ncbi:MAG TPA: M15 family metallopeptidase [Rectinemataceae bacterium]|nr:M15 family metallopeptidase [Rectinemataceae bacterium]
MRLLRRAFAPAVLLLLAALAFEGCSPASTSAVTLSASAPKTTAAPDPRLGSALAALDKAALEMGPAVAPALRSRIEASPKDFLDTLDMVLAERARDPERFARVDKVAPPLGSTFVPADLVRLDGLLPVARSGLTMRGEAANALALMAKAARADGVTLVAGSAYRSWEYQKGVFAREVKTYGEAAAKRESAEPGRSQHQLGTALDFSPIDDIFAKSPAFRWLTAKAGAYGFSRSYPDGMESVTGYRPESWHWRWIGIDAARLERDYFSGVQQYLIEFLAAY